MTSISWPYACARACRNIFRARGSSGRRSSASISPRRMKSAAPRPTKWRNSPALLRPYVRFGVSESECGLGQVHDLVVEVLDDAAQCREVRQHVGGEERRGGDLAPVERLVTLRLGELGLRHVGLHEEPPADQ